MGASMLGPGSLVLVERSGRDTGMGSESFDDHLQMVCKVMSRGSIGRYEKGKMCRPYGSPEHRAAIETILKWGVEVLEKIDEWNDPDCEEESND